MPNITIYNAASRGVRVDPSLVHAEDGDLVSAQNAIPDPDGDGGVAKRYGQTKFDTDTAAGSIVGFISAALGPGPSTGTSDQLAYYAANSAGTWFKSTDSFATSSAVTTLASATGYIAPPALWRGSLYYISTANTVRVFDGVNDALFSPLPSGFTTLTAIAVLDDHLYVAVETATPDARVLEFESNGTYRYVGALLTTLYSVSSFAFHQNDLYAVTVKNAGGDAKVHRIRVALATTTTAWTVDFTSAGGLSPSTGAFVSYKGLGYLTLNSNIASSGIVYQRSAAGSYSSVDTGNAAADPQGLAVYKGTLYVTWSAFNGTDNAVRKTTDGSTWATAATLGTESGFGPPIRFGNKLFIINSDETAVAGYYSTNGTSYTSFAVATGLRGQVGAFAASGTGASFGSGTAFIVLQGGTSLQVLNQSGALITLTMPTGIVLDATRPPRFTIYDRFVVMANTPSRPITIDADGIVRVLTPLPPAHSIELDDDGGAGALTGNYLALQTYVIKDEAGNVLSESDFSPIQETAFAASADTLDAEVLNLSAEDITGSRIYRTTAGGTTYFPWIDVDGNTLTQSVSDETTDAALDDVAAPTLGTPPNLALVASWRGRLWGTGRAPEDVDYANYSESGIPYAWPNTNRIPVGRIGSDVRGITAYLPRRDALGVGRRNSLSQITGTSGSDFRPVTLSETVGVESQETVVVYHDTAYFLSADGVYEWGSGGIKCISDEADTRTWFTTDDFFNRARFQYAFATIDPVLNKYRLHLAATGSSAEDRWVEFDLTTRTWWGPHKRDDGVTIVSAGVATDSSNRPIALMATSGGYLWKDQTTRTDDTSTAVSMSIVTKQHDGGTPNIDKVWGRVRVSTVPNAGVRMTITPSTGNLNGPALAQALQVSLTKGSAFAGRAGVGKALTLTFTQAVAGQNVELLGYEIPFFETGDR